MNETASRKKPNKGWYWLLLIPFIATLWPPFFAHENPMWGSFPFFYWYLFVWVIISSVITWIVYKATDEKE